jgi:hypothetical protein
MGTQIEWVNIANKPCLRIRIVDELTEESAKTAVMEWKAAFASKLSSGEKTTVICNCLKMNGYESNARKLWQNTIGELKNQIDFFWIVTDNKLFRIAGQTMGLLTKFKIKTVTSEADIIME